MKSRVFVVVLAVSVAALLHAGPSQQPGQVAPRASPPARPSADPNAPGTGAIRGRVLTGVGRPAVRASIRALGLSGADQIITAEADGRFEFTELKPDTYRITASKAGYVTLDYGQKRAFERGTQLTLADGQALANIDITLPSGGAIAGRVFDENGDPLEGVNVRALQSRYSGGRNRLLPVPGVGARGTDDTGRYRLFGMPPGDYVVVATPTNNPRFLPAKNQIGYAPSYYPGAAMPSEAQAVTVGLSQTTAGVDFALVAAAPSRISGAAFDSSNRPLGSNGTVALTTTDRSGGLAIAVQTRVNPDGSFQLMNVAPGEYVLQAIGPRPADQRGEGEFAAMPLAVNGQDIGDLVLQTSAGSRAAGRVLFEEGPRRVNPRDVVLVFAPIDLDRAPSNESFLHRWRAENDGTFEMTGLNGPRRLRLLAAPPSWTIRRVTADGVEVTDSVLSFGRRQDSIANLEILLTMRSAAVFGNVVDDRGRPVPDYTVVVFGTDPEQWHAESRFVKFTRPKTDGTFLVRGLPAGEYYVAAVDWMQGDELSGEWQAPEFLESMSRAALRLTLSEGEDTATTPTLIVR